jgi:hypothetical protein
VFGPSPAGARGGGARGREEGVPREQGGVGRGEERGGVGGGDVSAQTICIELKNKVHTDTRMCVCMCVFVCVCVFVNSGSASN